GGDHVLGAQDSQLLRHGRLVELEAGLELLHAALAGPEDLEDPDTDGVRQRLEELRLEGREIGGRRRAHKNSYIKVSLYNQVLTRDQRAVDLGGPRHRGVDRVPLADHGLAGPRHRTRALGVAEQVQDRGGECARVRRGYQAAVLAVADQLGASTDC